jgi:hypothetical protein
VGPRPLLLALAAACLGVALAAPGEGDRGETLVMQLWVRPGEPLAVVELPDGKPRIVRGLATAGGDPPLRVLQTGGRVVYLAGSGVHAIDPQLKGRPRKLGAGWYYIPSATDGRVWLTFADAADRDIGRVAEVTVRGRVTARGGPPPCPGASVLAATADALLCQDRDGLVAFEPRSGRVLRRLAGPFPLDTDGDLVAWCDEGCPRLHVTDVETGSDEAIVPGPGFRFEESYEGAFAPGGALLAAPVMTRSGRHVALLDVATGKVTVIGRLAGYRNLTWSGRRLYFEAPGSRIAEHDITTGRTRRLGFRLRSRLLDMS